MALVERFALDLTLATAISASSVGVAPLVIREIEALEAETKAADPVKRELAEAQIRLRMAQYRFSQAVLAQEAGIAKLNRSIARVERISEAINHEREAAVREGRLPRCSASTEVSGLHLIPLATRNG